MKKQTFALALPFLGGAFLFACSAAPTSFPSRSSSDDGSPADDLMLPASSDTTSAIGVTRWGATSAGATTTVHGYDEENNLIVTLTHTVSNVSSQESTIKDTVSGKLGSAALAVQMMAGEPDANGEIEVTTTVTKNTFEPASGPANVLAAALADQGSDANWSEAKASAGASLETHALHPDDVNLSSSSSSSSGGDSLVKCVDMTVSCVKSIATAVADGFKAASSCSGLAKDVMQTATCATDGKSGKTNVADGGLRGPILRGANCSAPSSNTTSTAASGCVKDATDAVKGGADSVDACAKIAGCADGGGGGGGGSEAGALRPAGS